MTGASTPQSEAFDHGLSARGLWLLMGTIAAMTAFAPFSTDLYLPALPNLADELGASDSAVQLTLTATFIGMMIGQLVFGPMSDTFGRRRLVIITTLATIVSALACALAPTIGFLTVARLSLGLTGGAGIVIGRAIAADMYKGPEAARFFSLLVSITMLAPLIGPLVGGALLGWTHTWRASFVFLTGFVSLLAIAIVVIVPETLPPDRRHTGGFRELRRGASVLFRDRVFLGYAFTQTFGFATLFAFIASSSFVFQEAYGLSPTMYSIVFAGIVLSLLGVGILNRRLLLVVPARRLLVVSLVTSMVASLALVPIAVSMAPLWPLILVLVVIVGMRASIGANSMALGLERSPYAGTASALLGAMMFGGVLVAMPLLAVLPFAVAPTMAVVMSICSVLAFSSTVVLARTGRVLTSAASTRRESEAGHE